jgi:hypothetical protein
VESEIGVVFLDQSIGDYRAMSDSAMARLIDVDHLIGYRAVASPEAIGKNLLAPVGKVGNYAAMD